MRCDRHDGEPIALADQRQVSERTLGIVLELGKRDDARQVPDIADVDQIPARLGGVALGIEILGPRFEGGGIWVGLACDLDRKSVV